jgi:hypothetical protein
MPKMRSFMLLFIIPALSGCGEVLTKDEIIANQRNISYVLRGQCYSDYIYKYQMYNGYPYKKRDYDTAFAVFQDSINGAEFQACGFATAVDVKNGYIVTDAPSDDIENVAIARCEADKLEKNINSKTPCTIFARGSTILWKHNQDIGLQSGSNKAKGRWY